MPETSSLCRRLPRRELSCSGRLASRVFAGLGSASGEPPALRRLSARMQEVCALVPTQDEFGRLRVACERSGSTFVPFPPTLVGAGVSNPSSTSRKLTSLLGLQEALCLHGAATVLPCGGSRTCRRCIFGAAAMCAQLGIIRSDFFWSWHPYAETCRFAAASRCGARRLTATVSFRCAILYSVRRLCVRQAWRLDYPFHLQEIALQKRCFISQPCGVAPLGNMRFVYRPGMLPTDVEPDPLALRMLGLYGPGGLRERGLPLNLAWTYLQVL